MVKHQKVRFPKGKGDGNRNRNERRMDKQIAYHRMMAASGDRFSRQVIARYEERLRAHLDNTAAAGG